MLDLGANRGAMGSLLASDATHQRSKWRFSACLSPSTTSPLEWKMVGLWMISRSPGCRVFARRNLDSSAMVATTLQGRQVMM